MPSPWEIEEILKRDLEKATSYHKLARSDFEVITSDIPSGLPHPDGTQRIQNAARAQTAARNALLRALTRFNEFVITGRIPDDLDRR
jgi:hypothetical protein